MVEMRGVHATNVLCWLCCNFASGRHCSRSQDQQPKSPNVNNFSISLVGASAAADLFSKLSLFYEKQCVVDISLLKGILSWISIVNRFTRINSIEGCILHDCVDWAPCLGSQCGAGTVTGPGRPPPAVPSLPGEVVEVVEDGGSQSQHGQGRTGGADPGQACQAVQGL